MATISPTSYTVDIGSFVKKGKAFNFTLNLQGHSELQAAQLTAELAMYQGGIMRLRINEVGGQEQRFRVSSEQDFAVMEDQLVPTISDVQVDSERAVLFTENGKFVVSFAPFRIQSYVGETLVMTLNEQDTLYFEKSTGVNADTCTNQDGSYATQIDYQMAVGMGASLETPFLYGLSERESSLLLQDTWDTDPYRFFNIDYYAHQSGDARGEYGSIPYITGHTATRDTSLLWLNAADTWTDLMIDGDRALSNFVSESGILELFVFSSSSPKQQLRNLATISGHAPKPPVEALGFHFSKYAETTAEIMLSRDDDFEAHGFPVDYYWMDILYSYNFEYFTFDPVKFPKPLLDQLNEQIALRQRRLVVITDPHISTRTDNWVYTQGLAQDVFMRDCRDDDFVGDCWPGASVWVDYLNQNAQTFWQGLYAYDAFQGTTQIYSYWNDMNEPSVFGAEQQTLPLQSQHRKTDGTVIKHRDARNIYGSMMHRTTFRGVLERDEMTRRPFVLTRSFFTGSQKYGAYWTGDNTTNNSEVQGSLYTLLSTGLTGMFFGGADIPGY